MEENRITTREEQRVEALRRMERLDLDKFIIDTFKKESLALCTRARNWITGGIAVIMSEVNEELMSKIREIEERHGIMVYAVTETNTEFGLLHDLIYVSKYMEEWEIDEEMIKDNIVMSYCINETIDYFSEFGSIGIENLNGGFVRAF